MAGLRKDESASIEPDANQGALIKVSLLPDVSQHDTGSVASASREGFLQVRDWGELPKPKRRDEGPVLRGRRELRNGPSDNALG